MSTEILIDTLSSFLNNCTEITEYELICALQNPPYEILDKDALSDPLTMFQCHFVLFNGLYQLQSRWQEQQHKRLIIESTRITIAPYVSGGRELGFSDKLKAYYLNWQNFESTGAEDVTDLLDAFWKKVVKFSVCGGVSEEQQRKALQILGLDQPACWQQIKTQYRKMLHQHHPDKGGELAYSQDIEWAYRLLKSCQYD